MLVICTTKEGLANLVKDCGDLAMNAMLAHTCISVFKMVSQEKCLKFEAGPGYIVSARAARDTVRPCLKTKQTATKKHNPPHTLCSQRKEETAQTSEYPFSQPHSTTAAPSGHRAADLLGTAYLTQMSEEHKGLLV